MKRGRRLDDDEINERVKDRYYDDDHPDDVPAWYRRLRAERDDRAAEKAKIAHNSVDAGE